MKLVKNNRKGFALIEILVAITILSIILLSVFSGVSSSISVMSGSKNFSRAILIAKSKMNEFILLRMRGSDLNNRPIEEFPGFYFSRNSQKFEHFLLGPIDAKKTDIIVTWKESNRDRKYSISYIYPGK